MIADINMRYDLLCAVSYVTQTDLEPEHLWDSSVYIGAPASVVLLLSTSEPTFTPTGYWSGFSTFSSVISLGNYSFTSTIGGFSIYNDYGPVSPIDGFSFSFNSSEVYFTEESEFQIYGVFSTLSLGYILSASPLELVDHSSLDPNLTDANFIKIDGASPGHPYVGDRISHESLRLQIISAESAIIPEPAHSTALVAFSSMALYIRRRKKLTKR